MSIVIDLVMILMNLFGIVVLLRFFMQAFRADFYNPLAQSIVKITNPLLLPLRKVIPGFGGFDIASLLLAFVIYSGMLTLVFGLWRFFDAQFLLPILLVFVLELAYAILNFFFYLVIARIILSFIMMGQNFARNPMADMIIQLTQPVMAPFQRIIPPIGMLDLSPIALFFAIHIAKKLLLGAANYLLPGIYLL